MHKYRNIGGDFEFAALVKGRALPYADLHKGKTATDVASLNADSSNGEFGINAGTCCALFLDNVSNGLYLAKKELRRWKMGASIGAGAQFDVHKPAYKKWGTPRSTMSGCNPSRHAMQGCEFIAPFGEIPYELILSEHGTCCGSHFHADIAEDEWTGIVLRKDMSWKQRFDHRKLSDWIMRKICMAMIPTLYAMRSSGDDDGIKKRFKLLPLGYFRIKNYGVEFKDFPSTILKSPAYSAAAFMSVRSALNNEWPESLRLEDAVKAITYLDWDYIEKAFSILSGIFAPGQRSWGTTDDWKLISRHVPAAISKEWEWTETRMSQFESGGHIGHTLGLTTFAWRIRDGQL